MSAGNSGYTGLLCMFGGTIVLGLALVWINIERLDQAYELKKLEHELQVSRDQNSKLQVERQYLLAPATLREKADKAGLHPAHRDQIRMIQ